MTSTCLRYYKSLLSRKNIASNYEISAWFSGRSKVPAGVNVREMGTIRRHTILNQATL